jgi:hypothetical protein
MIRKKNVCQNSYKLVVERSETSLSTQSALWLCVPSRFITAVAKRVAKSPNMPPRWSPKIHNLNGQPGRQVTKYAAKRVAKNS